MINKDGKNIIICLDGTGAKLREHNTNVIKLYRILERKPDHQIIYYDPGVGTLGGPEYKTPLDKQVNRLLGLALGKGILRNVEEAYSFLMDNYQEGDRIFLFGFSRGAYTARALAALIHSVGLLDAGCQNLIPYAMELFNARSPNWKLLKKFKKTYGRNCSIHFLGLWDSVKTFGWIYDPIFLPYTTNNKSVETVRHAIAIDERRNFFRSMPWGDDNPPNQDIKQVWFAGVHGDVGGGYPEGEAGLSKITLRWMIEEAQKAGLLIDQNNYEFSVLGKGADYYVAPNPLAKQHESLIHLWWLVQYFPRVVWNPAKDRKVLSPSSRTRTVPNGAVLHTSVLERLKSGDYKPQNLGLISFGPSTVEDILREQQYTFEPPLIPTDKDKLQDIEPKTMLHHSS